jgi:hypothetical protein
MLDSFAHYVSLLDRVAVALDKGDWRTATLGLIEGGAAGDHPELVDVVFCLRCITRSLKFQSVDANVQAAWYQVEAAVRKLGIDPQANLSAEPARSLHDGLTHLRWATSRLVMREYADLAALRLIFVELRPGRRELVYAAVEHLTLIEFDPFTVRVHPRDRELTSLDDDAYRRWRAGNRMDICARASQLRQFANVRNGSVNERAWHRMGGYPYARELALRVLANEPLTRGRPEFPVRLGRRRARSYARDWLKDTAAA